MCGGIIGSFGWVCCAAGKLGGDAIVGRPWNPIASKPVALLAFCGSLSYLGFASDGLCF